MSREVIEPYFSKTSYRLRWNPIATKVADIVTVTDEELIAHLKTRILPTETPDVTDGDRQYLRENTPTQYITTELTVEQLRWPSFRDASQSNAIMDDRGIVLNILLPYDSTRWHKNQVRLWRIIEVSESRLWARAISRRFGKYLTV